MFKHNCKIHGHRFEARYSEKPNEMMKWMEAKGRMSSESLRELIILRTYEYDICTKCGKKIKNKE